MATAIRSRLAQQDLEEILDDLDGQGGDAVDRFAVRFDDACELHARNPRLGAFAEEYAAREDFESRVA